MLGLQADAELSSPGVVSSRLFSVCYSFSNAILASDLRSPPSASAMILRFAVAVVASILIFMSQYLNPGTHPRTPPLQCSGSLSSKLFSLGTIATDERVTFVDHKAFLIVTSFSLPTSLNLSNPKAGVRENSPPFSKRISRLALNARSPLISPASLPPRVHSSFGDASGSASTVPSASLFFNLAKAVPWHSSVSLEAPSPHFYQLPFVDRSIWATAGGVAKEPVYVNHQEICPATYDIQAS